jgi:maltose O-acetyltransferase
MGQWSKLRFAVADELGALRPRLLLANAAMSALPEQTLSRVRTHLMRLAGFEIGHGTAIFGAPSITGGEDVYRRLKIGEMCEINIGLVIDLGADLTIGDRVSIGHQVTIITSNHKIGPAEHRAGLRTPQPVRIEAGAWICARATILPGVTVGSGSIVSAGAVVVKDVPPNTAVAGSPARVVVPRLR